MVQSTFTNNFYVDRLDVGNTRRRLRDTLNRCFDVRIGLGEFNTYDLGLLETFSLINHINN